MLKVAILAGLISFIASTFSAQAARLDSYVGEMIYSKYRTSMCSSYGNLAAALKLLSQGNMIALSDLDCIVLNDLTDVIVISSIDDYSARVMLKLPNGKAVQGYVRPSAFTNDKMDAEDKAYEARRKKEEENRIIQSEKAAERAKYIAEYNAEIDLARKEKYEFYQDYEGVFITAEQTPVCLLAMHMEDYKRWLPRPNTIPICWLIDKGVKIVLSRSLGRTENGMRHVWINGQSGNIYLKALAATKIDVDYKVFCESRKYKHATC